MFHKITGFAFLSLNLLLAKTINSHKKNIIKQPEYDLSYIANDISKIF